MHYTQVIWELMKKIERRSLCLVLSADSDGAALADSMARVAKDEKWIIKKILWLVGKSMLSLEKEIESIIAEQSDVVVVHSRDKDNGLLFKSMGNFTKTDTIWVLTEITVWGISNLEVLPAGFIKTSARKRDANLDDNLYSDAIYDALLLFQAAFDTAYGKIPYQTSEKDTFFENRDNRDILDQVRM